MLLGGRGQLSSPAYRPVTEPAGDTCWLAGVRGNGYHIPLDFVCMSLRLLFSTGVCAALQYIE